jgi:hypothetical protein
MATWFEAKRAGGFPVLGLENDAGELLEFASYGPFRAFKYTVEHSVYVRQDQRGWGRDLMQALIAEARRHEVHALISAIDADNTGSIAALDSSTLKRCRRSVSSSAAGSISRSISCCWRRQRSRSTAERAAALPSGLARVQSVPYLSWPPFCRVPAARPCPRPRSFLILSCRCCWAASRWRRCCRCKAMPPRR